MPSPSLKGLITKQQIRITEGGVGTRIFQQTMTLGYLQPVVNISVCIAENFERPLSKAF